MNGALWVLAAGFALAVYTYIGYPLLVALVGSLRKPVQQPPLQEWPRISITVPAYNEEREIGTTLDRLLEIDYPADRREIIVVSDASTDGTDEIVRGYADRGVMLVRMEQRSGKTAAENAAAAHLTGDIVVNTDASIRIARDSMYPLIAAFADPTVGVASGRDISVARGSVEGNSGESKYVGYEMMVRKLETRAGGIIGASGCLYAIRAHLHRTKLADGLSRDFASALIARLNGYRAVSVDEAICYVARTPVLRAEYRRKVRTMTRGMETLFAMRTLLNPLRYGRFAWMLWSHKICRWLLPWAMAASLVAIAVLAPQFVVARVLIAMFAAGAALGLAAFTIPEGKHIPPILATPAYIISGNFAALQSAIRAAHGDRNAVWEPTRREPAGA
jgi:cellulose synthase/poly-beta-1,6-N-acetylglucosamine synthase-like glycosyltransferase